MRVTDTDDAIPDSASQRQRQQTVTQPCPGLSLVIRNLDELRAAFMPFVKGGGLFVPCSGGYRLGDIVQVQFSLMDASTPRLIPGSVVWLTPQGIRGRRLPGIGIRLPEADEDIRASIERLLMTSQPSHFALTHTI